MKVGFPATLGAVFLTVSLAAQEPAFPDLREVPADLRTPPVEIGAPAPGRRVRGALPRYAGTDIHHALYLPTNWRAGGRYPVIVEYAGNGPFESRYGDYSAGTVEGSNMGFGISGGEDFLWISLPFVNPAEGVNQRWWWGDPEATVEYAIEAVRMVCEEYGGDPAAVFLAGFSRGAIASNYIGLFNDAIADVWLAFIPYSHYDGVRRWEWSGSDEASALERLRRLKGRATFVSHERSAEATREYLAGTGVIAPFTFLAIPYRNHNDAWLLRDIPERKLLRDWVRRVLVEKPGTYSISGRVRDAEGLPVAGARVESGATHWTRTEPDGRFLLEGLVESRRVVAVVVEGRKAPVAEAKVVVAGEDVTGVALTLDPVR